jgi:pimeloyl-ACP methyl ester carboxylesterase
MEKIISKDGTSIAFDKTGKGPALVLVDGAFCFRDYGTTPNLIPLISDVFTVFSYDRRGRGDSSDTLPYSPDNEIEDLRAVISKTEGVPFICGFSSGASLVLQALNQGIRAKKVVLFEPPYVFNSHSKTLPPDNAIMILRDLVGQGKRGNAVKYFMTKVMGMPGFIVFMFKQLGKSMWRKNESVAHTLAYDVAIMGDYSLSPKIASSVNVPVLVVGGEKSPENIRNAVQATSKAIPGTQVKWLSGQSHSVSMQILAPCLIDFFKA